MNFKVLKILITLGFLAGLAMSYFKISSLPKRPVYKQCEPLPVTDGYVSVVEHETGINLKLPYYANIRRGEELGCHITRFFSIDYLWYENQLVPAGEYNVRVKKGLHKKGHYLPVRIYFWNAWTGERPPRSNPIKPWQLEPAIPHKKFPLEFYPRFYWDDPDSPSEKSLNSARLDQRWGIANTKYKQVGNGLPFRAFCSIPPLDKADPDSRVKNDFAHYGDSKCRGGISASQNGKGLFFTVDVWAYKKPTQKAVQDINLIYDALVEQIDTFIKE